MIISIDHFLLSRMYFQRNEVQHGKLLFANSLSRVKPMIILFKPGVGMCVREWKYRPNCMIKLVVEKEQYPIFHKMVRNQVEKFLCKHSMIIWISNRDIQDYCVVKLLLRGEAQHVSELSDRNFCAFACGYELIVLGKDYLCHIEHRTVHFDNINRRIGVCSQDSDR